MIWFYVVFHIFGLKVVVSFNFSRGCVFVGHGDKATHSGGHFVEPWIPIPIPGISIPIPFSIPPILIPIPIPESELELSCNSNSGIELTPTLHVLDFKNVGLLHVLKSLA